MNAVDAGQIKAMNGTNSQELRIKTKRKESMMDGDGYVFGVLLTYYDSCIHSILLFHIVRISSRTNAATSLKIRVCSPGSTVFLLK
jgi:hypothetical protein